MGVTLQCVYLLVTSLTIVSIIRRAVVVTADTGEFSDLDLSMNSVNSMNSFKTLVGELHCIQM